MRSQRTHDLALSSLMCALAVVFLWLSGVLPLATYGWPILASFTLVIEREECKRGYAWCCFAASAALGLLLCADKEAALVFTFLGYYPLLKPRFDAIVSKTLRCIAKLALCIVATGTMYVLILFVFQLDAVVREFNTTAPWLLWATVSLGLLLFFVYDLALTRLTAVYLMRKGSRNRGN